MRLPIVFAALTATLFAVLSGCVPQERYDELLNTNRSMQQQLLQCQSDLETANANETNLRNQISQAAEQLARLNEMAGGKDKELGDLLSKYQELLGRVDTLNFGPLPESVNRALRDLADQHPDLLSFDSRTGMLRFAADFTFDLGSDQLKPAAADTINRLAAILNDPQIADKELVVLGHTDNVPIAKAETRAKHASNVHLSCHRAISVRNALVSSRVNPGRIECAGFGEFHPITPNGSRGAAANRRVEVYITGRVAQMGEIPLPSKPLTGPTKPASNDEPMK